LRERPLNFPYPRVTNDARPASQRTPTPTTSQEAPSSNSHRPSPVERAHEACGPRLATTLLRVLQSGQRKAAAAKGQEQTRRRPEEPRPVSWQEWPHITRALRDQLRAEFSETSLYRHTARLLDLPCQLRSAVTGDQMKRALQTDFGRYLPLTRFRGPCKPHCRREMNYEEMLGGERQALCRRRELPDSAFAPPLCRDRHCSRHAYLSKRCYSSHFIFISQATGQHNTRRIGFYVRMQRPVAPPRRAAQAPVSPVHRPGATNARASHFRQLIDNKTPLRANCNLEQV